jgi:hypothetical protein
MSAVARIKSPPSRAGSFFVVVVIFVSFGPLVGGLAVWISVSAARLVNIGISNDPIGYFSMLALILLFCHLVGIVYALIAGIVVASAGIFMRWNNLLVPFLAAAAASLIGPFVPWFYSKLSMTGAMDGIAVFQSAWLRHWRAGSSREVL